MVMHKKSYY